MALLEVKQDHDAILWERALKNRLDVASGWHFGVK